MLRPAHRRREKRDGWVEREAMRDGRGGGSESKGTREAERER